MTDTYKYCKGDHIIYGSFGICYVEDIKSMSFSGVPERNYYILRPTDNERSTYYVPVDASADDKLRRVLSKEQIDSLIDEIKGKKLEWIENRTEREVYFKNILQHGDYVQILLMVSLIFIKRRELTENKKKLTVSDEQILKSSEKYIGGEFAFALNISPDTVPSYIQNRLSLK